MKEFTIGLVLFIGGLVSMQNPYLGLITCCCGGILIGVGIYKITKKSIK